jgi:hypothetical protein
MSYILASKMETVKIRVNYGENKWQIKVPKECTVASLMYKLRRYAKLSEHDAIFLLFRAEGWVIKTRMFVGTRTMEEIQQATRLEILEVDMLRESTFGTLSKMFVKCRIEQRKQLYCAIITYSFYGLYHFDEMSVHETLEQATAHLLRERCSGHLSLDVEKK